MKVLRTWEEVKEVCERLCRNRNGWAKKYYKDAFNHTFLYCKGIKEKLEDSAISVQKLKMHLEKQGYEVDEVALLEDMYTLAWE